MYRSLIAHLETQRDKLCQIAGQSEVGSWVQYCGILQKLQQRTTYLLLNLTLHTNLPLPQSSR